jgi:phosphatidylglycerol---prolipoprotein diacylglyceryl transferase
MLWLAGVLAGLWGAVMAASPNGLDPQRMYAGGLWALLGAFVGATAFYLPFAPAGIAQPSDLLRLADAPKGSFGALAGAVLAGAAYLRARKAEVLAYADVAIPFLALGYAVLRIGCFINGDDFGAVTGIPWALSFPAGSPVAAHHYANGWVESVSAASLPVHPTQLYHAAAGFGLFLALRRYPVGAAGTRLAAGLVGYGATRFMIEFFRDDPTLAWAGLRLEHLLSLALLAAGMGLAVHLRLARHTPVPAAAA